MRHAKSVIGALTLVSALSILVAFDLDHREERAAQIPNHHVVFEGTFEDVAPARGGKLRGLLQVSGTLERGRAAPLRARLVVKMPGDLDVSAGDRVRVRGRARDLSVRDRAGAFDEVGFARARDYDRRLSVYRASDVVVLERDVLWTPFADLRSALRARLHQLVPPREAGVLLALLVGDTADFSDEQLAIYRDVGAGHLLAVSGLQVSLIALLCFALLSRVLARAMPRAARMGHTKRAAAVIALVSVWGFVGLCGAPPSAVRAGIMSSALLWCAARGHATPRSGLKALFMSAAISIAFWPFVVFDPSFVLSYAAVLGLIVVAGAKGSYLRRAALAALAAGLLTLPASAYLFGEVAPGGLIANIILVPLASVLQIPALLLGALGALTMSSTLAHLGALAAGVLEAVCEGLGAVLGGVFLVELSSALAAALLTTSALLVVIAVRAKRLAPISLAVVLTSAVFAPTLLKEDALRIDVLPVGQGDSSIFRFPSGEVFVVDGGGVYNEATDPGARVVVPALKRMGIDRVDAVVLSHPDPDHLLGLLAVIDAVQVKALWHPGYGDEHPLMKRLLARAKARGVQVKGPRELLGHHTFGETGVDVLAPTFGHPLEELSPNDNSLVLRIEHRGHAVLWTGDIETWGEMYLVESGKDLRADVVKAPHHGSKTSSGAALVRATGAEHVVYCTGRKNRFGFPHAPVKDRWSRAGARAWDTARHGQISISLGAGVEVRAFISPDNRTAAGSSPER